MTVPPSVVVRMAPPSQPGTSTQMTVTSAGPPALTTASRSAIGSRASATTTSSASPACVSRSASAWCGTTPMVSPAPACRAAARLMEPDFPAPPMTATVIPSSTTRAVRAGAPQTSITESARSAGRSSGMTAAIDRPKRTAYPSQGTCSPSPSQPARPSSMTSGVSVSETRVATRSPTDRPSGDCSPTSSTVPTSMPPEPVSGFCILPRAATISSTSARIRSPSPACLRSSWRYDAASRLSFSTRILTSSGHSSRRVSSRRAAWGRTSRSSSTRCRPVGSLSRASMADILHQNHDVTGNHPARHWTNRMSSSYSDRGGLRHTTDAPPSTYAPTGAAPQESSG